MKNVKILIGLPASGKTTFAKEFVDSTKERYGWRGSYKYKAKHIDVDNYLSFRHSKYSDISDIIQDSLSMNNNYESFVVDGLILTNEDIVKCIDCFNKNDSFEIHYWNPNIELCLRNDKYRRNENSRITIENAKLETIDLELIKKQTEANNIEIIYHEIEAKEDYKIFADKYNISLQDDLYMHSDTWSLGGSYENCWGTGGSISPDDQPKSFELLDDLLQEVCPSMSFLQYKKIENECVETGESSESDYYGGCEYFAYFKCDIEKLVDMLSKMNLIDINKL